MKDFLLKILFCLGLVEIIVAKSIFAFSNHEFLDLRAVAFLSTIFAILVLLSSALELKNLRTGLNSWFVVLQLLFWTGYLLVIFPGFYPYDAFTTLQITLSSGTDFWQSYLYTFISYGLSYFNSHLAVIPFVNVALWLGCLFFILHLFPLRSLRSLVVVSALAFLPLQIITLPLILRDTLFGTLSCVLVFQLIPFLRDRKKTVSTVYYLSLLFILCLASEVRHDGVVYYLLFPLLLWFSKNESLKKTVPLSMAFCGMMVGLNVFLTAKEAPQTIQRYELTAIIHPLNAIFYNPSASISPQDLEAVSKVIYPAHLQNSYNPVRIVQFHEGLYTLPISAEDWAKFKWTYLRLVLNNFPTFLKERVEMFAINFGYIPGAYIFSDDLESPPRRFLEEIPNNQLPKALPHFRELRTNIVNLWYTLVAHHRFLFSFTLLNPLFFLFTALMIARKNYETALLSKISSILLIGRSFVVFFLIPEPHLFYFSPLMYLPALVIIYSLLCKMEPKRI